jgi:phosphoserine phosphatase RsbU/P
MSLPESTPEPSASPLRGFPSRAREFCLKTWPGRLLGLGAVVKATVLGLDSAGLEKHGALAVVSTLGGLALAIGVGMLVYRLIQSASRNLLWRIRWKLIVSYIFIGVVPVFLVAAFFLLAGRLLFNNVSSYLVQASVREVAGDALAMAHAAATELSGPADDDSAYVAQQFDAFRKRYPSLSVAFVAVEAGHCSSLNRVRFPGQEEPPPMGPWQHIAVPEIIPAWLPCEGYAGVLVLPGPAAAGQASPSAQQVVVRAVVFRGDRAVVVDAPFDQAVRSRVEATTGVLVGAFSLSGESFAAPPDDGAGEARGFFRSFTTFDWVAMLDEANWDTGKTAPLQVTFRFGIADIYRRLSASQALLGDLLRVALMIIASLFLVIQIGAMAMGLALARSITGSIHELFEGTERVRLGDFGHRISVRVKDQLGALADSFNLMTGSIEDLLRQAAEKKRLEEEMRLAREIQMSLLPPGPLRVPGMTVSALCVPAREVGGDYYDVLPLEGGRVGVLIADVAGKGMSAALYMAELKGLMLSLTRIHLSPRDLLITANRLISEHLDSRSFITMTYAVIDPASCTMRYARAGHTPLIHVPADGAGPVRADVLAPDGMVVGLHIDEGQRFEQILQEATLRLAPGDLLAFFTDGISEAMNEESDCFGESRLAVLLEAHADLPVDQIRERVLREIDAFVGVAPQHDDMTMILLSVDREPCPSR